MEKIAIIGLSNLFPGAKTPEEFWQNLLVGKDSTSTITVNDLGVDPNIFYDPAKGKLDKFYSLQGGFIRDFNFNPSEYNLPAKFLEGLDETFQWSLYVAKQALHQSGYLGNKSVLSKCGVILGNLSLCTKSSYQLMAEFYQPILETAVKELLQQENFAFESPLGKVSLYNGLVSSFIASVVTQAFSLSNINFSLDAVCSSSFYSIKLASHYLLSHKADLMLAGAISCADPLFLRVGFSVLQAYPDNGISHPFDQSSRGVITSDGAGMVVLKRYSDALRDGDRILATICGNGLSNDGRGKHLLSPNSKGQIVAFERAYNEAQINPKDIDYLECHATGTLLGDSTEVSSIETFLGKHQATPLLGAVKGNVGHLLTTAGMVNLSKVISSMSNDTIPPTINVSEPIFPQQGATSAKQLVRTVTPWPKKSSIKRAAISAFGFGGNNAHLILEQGRLEENICASTPAPLTKIAIVGMDAFFGGCEGLNAFEGSIYEGKQHFISLPATRWMGIEDRKDILKEYGISAAPVGAYLKEIEIDPLVYKIPPHVTEKINPQHALMLQVANRAIQDAGLKEGANVAVIIAVEMDLTSHGSLQRWNLSWQLSASLEKSNISLPAEKIAQLETILKDVIARPLEDSEQVLAQTSSIIASRISKFWDFNGPSFALAVGENSALRALEVAQMLLSTEEVDAAVVGAIDFAGGVESVWWRNQVSKINTGVNTLSYDQFCDGWSIGEGGGAVVLKRYDTAKQNSDRIYATIDGISFAHKNSTLGELNSNLPTADANAVKQACQEAFHIAGIQPTDVNYLEVFGSGIPQQDQAEIAGLLQAYPRDEDGLNCAVGSVKANIGHTFVASGIASLIKTALCVYHKYIPGTPNWSGVKAPELWQGSSFYVTPESRPWLLDKKDQRRVAAINSMGMDGVCAHLILSEEPNQKQPSRNFLAQEPFYLFPLAADNRSQLIVQLENLQQTIENCSSLSSAASRNFVTFEQHQNAKYAIAILGHDKEELAREIKFAHQGVNNAFESTKDWQTPLGSYFTTNPLGKQGEIAYVYPPSMSSSDVNSMANINRLFPQLYEYASSSNKNLTDWIGTLSKLLMPRSLNKLTKEQQQTQAKQFQNNLAALFMSEIGVSLVYTLIMKSSFRIQPKFAFGYSMGEISMLIAQGVWSNFYEGIQALNSSSIFSNKLSGSKDIVRKEWGLPITTSTDNDFWSTYVLMASPSQVKECIKTENRVYLTQINSPEEVLIAGETDACKRVIKALNCNAFPALFNHIVHCEPMQGEYNELVKLVTYQTQKIPDIAFYSAADYAPISLDSHVSAHSVAKVLCNQVDFPRLVNRVYEDGARIFIEIGNSNNCSRWLDKILDDKEHLSLAIYKKEKDSNEHNSFVKGCAKLLSHRVPLDLSSFYEQVTKTPMPKKGITKTIFLNSVLSNHKIFEKLLTEKNRKIFQNSCSYLQVKLDINHNDNLMLPKEFQLLDTGKYENNLHQLSMKKLEVVTAKNTNLPTVLNSQLEQSQHQILNDNHSRLFQTYLDFLKTRQQSSNQIGEIIELKIVSAKKILAHRLGSRE